MAARRSIGAHESHIATWLNGGAAVLFGIGFAISLVWWQLALAIFFALSAAFWAVKTRRRSAT